MATKVKTVFVLIYEFHHENVYKHSMVEGVYATRELAYKARKTLSKCADLYKEIRITEQEIKAK